MNRETGEEKVTIDYSRREFISKWDLRENVILSPHLTIYSWPLPSL